MGYRFVKAKVDRALLGDALLVAGGLLIGLGVLLPWGKVVVGPLHENIAGINGWEGRFTGILAIGMLVRGALAWKAHQEGRVSRQAGVAVITGLLAAGIAVYDLVTARSEAMNDIVKSGAAKIAQQTGASLDFVTARLKELISTGVIRLDFQIGIYLVILGGAVAAAGSIVTLVRQRAAARTPPAAHTGWPAPAPWAGASGWSSPPSPRPDDGAGTSGTFTA